MRFVVLEDNIDRRNVMKSVLDDLFSTSRIEFFDSSDSMILHLVETSLADVSLISLDHDLEMLVSEDGQLTDPGSGVEVAEWLAGQEPVVPVIVATTNSQCGDRMVEILQTNAWNVHRIVPYDSERWIEEQWKRQVSVLTSGE